MNQKELRKINTQVKVILVEWVKTLLPEEEALKVNVDNVLDTIPSQTHFFANQQAQLSAYTPKWIRKHIKIIKRNNINIDISDICLEDILEVANAKTGI